MIGRGLIARWRRKRWLAYHGRSLEITKSGWLFILACLVVGFVAINSGSNLMHAIFGCQLGLIVASGWLSEIMLDRVRVRLELDADAHAGKPCPATVVIRNLHPTAAALSISVTPDPHRKSSTEFKPVFAASISPNDCEDLHTHLVFAERGHAKAPALAVGTGYPFGLFIKRREVDPALDAVVFPALAPPTQGAEVSPQSVVPKGTKTRQNRLERRAEGDFHGLAEYRAGENPALIHWRASARRGELVVARHESHENQSAFMDIHRGKFGAPQLEREVSAAATRSIALTRGDPYALGLRYENRILVEPGRGPMHVRKLLRQLAIVGERP